MRYELLRFTVRYDLSCVNENYLLSFPLLPKDMVVALMKKHVAMA